MSNRISHLQSSGAYRPDKTGERLFTVKVGCINPNGDHTIELMALNVNNALWRAYENTRGTGYSPTGARPRTSNGPFRYFS